MFPMAGKEIITLAKKMQATVKKAMVIYKQEFEDIIGSDCRDKERIE